LGFCIDACRQEDDSRKEKAEMKFIFHEHSDKVLLFRNGDDANVCP
jgi:hypothetical protein